MMKSFLKCFCFFVQAGFICCFSSCDGTDPAGTDNTDGELISTPVFSDIRTGSVQVSASTVMEDASIVQKGFEYSLSKDPTVSCDRVRCGGDGFHAEIPGLSSYTTYYLRAYVMTAAEGMKYSEQVSFTTALPALPQGYDVPDYSDDYVATADWSMRRLWNLANVHDPTVCLAEDGYYYMYQTDASYGNVSLAGGHFHGRRSKNLVDWEYLGGTMKSLPDWVPDKLNEIREAMGLPAVSAGPTEFGFWAPCVRKVRDGLYRMYYSIVVPGTIDGADSWSERAFIGLMETSDPSDNDSWVDKGFVITNASDRELDFHVNPTSWEECYFRWNAIDPSYIITPEGEHWLVYGSWHSGLAAVRLDLETGKPAEALPAPWGTADSIAPYGKRIFTRTLGSRWQGSEGPEIIYRDGWYYLFVAFDALDVPYNTRVVRSRSIDGPYEDLYGTDVSDAGGDAWPIVTHPYKFSEGYGWVGISHCAVFDDGHDNWYYASQGRFPVNIGGNAYSNALMMGHIRRIVWCPSSASSPDDLWPMVLPERYSGLPDDEPLATEDLIGHWEHINLKYEYAVQDASSMLTLFADGTMRGALSGKWSYDPSSGLLMLGNVAVRVEREVDWEASPRHATLVYTGINKSGRSTYWGKKVK